MYSIKPAAHLDGLMDPLFCGKKLVFTDGHRHPASLPPHYDPLHAQFQRLDSLQQKWPFQIHLNQFARRQLPISAK